MGVIPLRKESRSGFPAIENVPATQMFLISVEGYQEQVYVRGEMTYIGRVDLEGFIYTQDGKQVYLYGYEDRSGVISAYDRLGNHYLLRPVKE